MHIQTKPNPYYGPNPVSPTLDLEPTQYKFGPKTSALMLTAMGLAPLLPINPASAGGTSNDSFSDPLDTAKPVPLLTLKLKEDRFKLNAKSFNWKNFELADETFQQSSKFSATTYRKNFSEGNAILSLLKNKSAKENLDLSALSSRFK